MMLVNFYFFIFWGPPICREVLKPSETFWLSNDLQTHTGYQSSGVFRIQAKENLSILSEAPEFPGKVSLKPT